ncbi:MAG TPA: cytochrome c oxidase assembly protein [Candidatus Dormibacteraeota bacterium]
MSAASLGPTDWNFDPTVIAGLLALAALYGAAYRQGLLSARDDVSPWLPSARWRPWLFALGLLSALVALQSPIDRGGDAYLLSLHMVQHLMLMMIAPPLALLGIVGMRPFPRGLHPRLRALWTAITRPWPALIIFNAVLLTWHIPQLYNTTLTNDPLHIFEHVTFVLVGVIFWWPVVDPIRGPETIPVGSFQKIVMLVLAGVPPTVLGFVFAMSPHALYPFYAAAPRLWGMSPTGDQAVAGVIMLGLGNLIYFAAISVIFLRMFGDPAADEVEIGLGVAR